MDTKEQDKQSIKKSLAVFLKRYEWILLLSLTGLSWVLGFIGFSIYFLENGETKTITDLIYVTIQLFTLESGFIDGHVPLVLEFARFLAPFSLATAAFAALLWLLRQKFKLLKLRRYKNHIVFVGLGKSGLELLKNLQEQNEKIVVVTQEELAAADKPDHLNTVFIVKSTNDYKVLVQLRLEHAKYVLCMADNVQQNLTAGNFMGKYKGLDSKSESPKIFIQTTPFLMEQMQELDFDDKASENYKMFGHRINFFSVYERAARLLAKEYSPDKFAAADFAQNSKIQAHILIAGFGFMGQALLLQAGKMFHFANRNKLKATVLYKNLEEVEGFMKTYPGVQDVIDLQFIEQSEINKRNAQEKTGDTNVHCIFICAPDDSIALDAYNKTNAVFPESQTVFCHEIDGFTQRIVRNNVSHFNIDKETLNINSLVKEDIDAEAKVVHQSYMLKEQTVAEKLKELKRLTHLDWNSLTERTKNANRNQADHIDIKLRAVGFKVEEGFTEADRLFDFAKKAELIELLAEIEHRRWNAEQLLNGWVFGKKRDNQKKIHDNIIPYSELTDPIKQYDRDAVVNIPLILSAVGKRVLE